MFRIKGHDTSLGIEGFQASLFVINMAKASETRKRVSGYNSLQLVRLNTSALTTVVIGVTQGPLVFDIFYKRHTLIDIYT